MLHAMNATLMPRRIMARHPSRPYHAHALWVIMPGSLPIYDSETRNELTVDLPQGGHPELERDVNGARREPDRADSFCSIAAGGAALAKALESPRRALRHS